MKFETYKNWRITTERDLPSCCGLTRYTDIVTYSDIEYQSFLLH